MKKIIISISTIVLFILLAILSVLLINNQGKRIEITSYDKTVTIGFGKHKISNYKKDCISGANQYVSFDVQSNRDFYNNVIKSNEYYFEDLEFKIEGYFAYGFLCKDNQFFKYTIIESSVKIEGVQGTVDTNEDTYFINAPVYPYITVDTLTDFNYLYHKEVTDSHITYNMLIKMIKHLDESYYLINEDYVLLKGVSETELLNHKKVFSDYLLKLVNENNKVVVLYAE